MLDGRGERGEVPGGLDPGIYRAYRVWVETVGGRTYEYEDEDRKSLREAFAFEVLAEPDVTPELRLTYDG